MTRETHAISLEVLNDFNHLSTVFLHTGEGLFIPESEGRLGLLIETVKFIKQVNLVFSFDQLGVLLMRESEERLTSICGVVLLLDHFEFITLGLQSF